jgi:hypothetical protein
MVRTGGRQKRIRTDFEIRLRKDILDKKRNDGTPYSEKSVDNFIDNIFKISKNFLKEDEPMVNLKWAEDSKKMIHFVNTTKTRTGKEYSIQSKLCIYQAIIVCMNTMGYDETHLKPYWSERDYQRVLHDDKIKNKISTNTITAQNQDGIMDTITTKDLTLLKVKLYSESVDGDELMNRNKLMLATMLQIHEEFPFRNDLADVKVLYSKKEYEDLVKTGEDKFHNWLIKDKGEYTFILNKFKTQKKYNMIIGEVETDSTKHLLNEWLRLNDIKTGEFLFSKDGGKQLTRNYISVFLSTETKKYFKLPISTTMLAKLYNVGNEEYSELTREMVSKMEKQAYLRGHNIQTRMTHYTRRK